MTAQQPKEDPCYTECDDCQRHECNMAGECLASDPEKVERKEAYNRSRPHPAPALFQIEPNSHNYTIGQIVEINENIQKQRAEAARTAREDVHKRLLALQTEAEGIECVTLADIECLFAELSSTIEQEGEK